MKILQETLPAFFSFILLGYVIYYQSPPESWSQASFFNWLEFFLPLSLFLFFTSNIFFQNLFKSFLISLAVTLIIVLQGQQKLTLFNLLFITFSLGFILYKLQKPKNTTLSQRHIKFTKLKRQY